MAQQQQSSPGAYAPTTGTNPPLLAFGQPQQAQSPGAGVVAHGQPPPQYYPYPGPPQQPVMYAASPGAVYPQQPVMYAGSPGATYVQPVMYAPQPGFGLPMQVPGRQQQGRGPEGVPAGDAERVIVQYRKTYMHDCNVSFFVPLTPAQLAQLEQAGVSRAEIESVFQDYIQNVASKDMPACWALLLFLSVVGCFVIIPLGMRFFQAFKDWVARSNARVFEPKGLYMKTQYEYIDEGRDNSWLVIALTREDAARLRMEPHRWDWNGKLFTPSYGGNTDRIF
jgi:hypothetical protein